MHTRERGGRGKQDTNAPASRQCFSIRRDRATSPVRARSAGSWQGHLDAPMLISNSLFLVSLGTLVCFLSSVWTPRSRRSRKKLISSSGRRCWRESVMERGRRTSRTCEHLWKPPDSAQYLSHQPICTAERRVGLDSDTDQPTGYGKRDRATRRSC